MEEANVPYKIDLRKYADKDIDLNIKDEDLITRDSNKDFDANLTFGQRVADRVAAFGGSWTFIISFCAVLATWVGLNSIFLVRAHDVFDPYPYILLNLFLSMLASIQAPFIIMSQNRQAAKDRITAANNYQVNLKAEREIMRLHRKMDHFHDRVEEINKKVK